MPLLSDDGVNSVSKINHGLLYYTTLILRICFLCLKISIPDTIEYMINLAHLLLDDRTLILNIIDQLEIRDLSLSQTYPSLFSFFLSPLSRPPPALCSRTSVARKYIRRVCLFVTSILRLLRIPPSTGHCTIDHRFQDNTVPWYIGLTKKLSPKTPVPGTTIVTGNAIVPPDPVIASRHEQNAARYF